MKTCTLDTVTMFFFINHAWNTILSISVFTEGVYLGWVITQITFKLFKDHLVLNVHHFNEI